MARPLRALVGAVVVLALVGGIEAWLVARVVAGAAMVEDAADFVRTPCSHVAVSAIEGSSRYRTWYRPRLVCTYSVDGQTFEVDSETAELGFAAHPTEETAREEARAYGRRHPLHAFYERRDPARATMSRDATGADGDITAAAVLGAIPALLSLLATIMLAIRFMRARRRELRARAELPAARALDRRS